MDTNSNITVSCSKCSARTTVRAYRSINVAQTPELKAKVKDGSLFIWECPHCGCRNLLRQETLYHDPEQKLMVWVTCGNALLEEKVQSSYGEVEELKDYTLRFVDDTGSLVEKVNIFDAGLDDMALELCKRVTKMELCEQLDEERAAAVLEAPFKFLRTDGADGEITFSYPLDGAMQVVAIGFNVYEDAAAILSRHPQVKDGAPGFLRVDQNWLAGIVSL